MSLSLRPLLLVPWRASSTASLSLLSCVFAAQTVSLYPPTPLHTHTHSHPPTHARTTETRNAVVPNMHTPELTHKRGGLCVPRQRRLRLSCSAKTEKARGEVALPQPPRVRHPASLKAPAGSRHPPRRFPRHSLSLCVCTPLLPPSPRPSPSRAASRQSRPSSHLHFSASSRSADSPPSPSSRAHPIHAANLTGGVGDTSALYVSFLWRECALWSEACGPPSRPLTDSGQPTSPSRRRLCVRSSTIASCSPLHLPCPPPIGTRHST